MGRRARKRDRRVEPILMTSSPAIVVSFMWIVTVKMQCERDDALVEETSEARRQDERRTKQSARLLVEVRCVDVSSIDALLENLVDERYAQKRTFAAL